MMMRRVKMNPGERFHTFWSHAINYLYHLFFFFWLKSALIFSISNTMSTFAGQPPSKWNFRENTITFNLRLHFCFAREILNAVQPVSGSNRRKNGRRNSALCLSGINFSSLPTMAFSHLFFFEYNTDTMARESKFMWLTSNNECRKLI